MTDLEYTNGKMFTTFYANTDAGIAAWNEMASKMQGVAKVLNFESQRVIKELKSAGYTVKKAKKSKISMDQIFKELEGL